MSPYFILAVYSPAEGQWIKHAGHMTEETLKSTHAVLSKHVPDHQLKILKLEDDKKTTIVRTLAEMNNG
jgi:hypothetical protein